MPAKITAGLAQKVGMPDFGSLGASCNVELEVDPAMLQDLDAFHRQVKFIYTACHQAVQDELARRRGPQPAPATITNGQNHAPHTQAVHRNGDRERVADRRYVPTPQGMIEASQPRPTRNGSVRKATVSQARAIRAIAGKNRVDLAGLLQQRFGVQGPEDLSIGDASALIDELKDQAAGDKIMTAIPLVQITPKNNSAAPGLTFASDPEAKVNNTGQHPNDTAQRLIGRPYLSYSSLSCFAQCPLRFYFRYVEQLPEPTVSASLVFGQAIHAAIQAHYDALAAGEPSPGEDLLTAYWIAWLSHGSAEVIFAKGDDKETLGNLANRVLKTFEESEIAKPAGKILGIEEELTGPLASGCPDMLARLDLMVDAGDELVITDFKTARSRWSNEQLEMSAGQLLLYGELARPIANGRSIRLQFAVLTKTKTPSIEVIPVSFTPQQIDRQRQIVQKTWRAIQAGNFFPNPSLMNCSGCPYREPCRHWSG